MMPLLHWLRDEPLTGADNMARDEALLYSTETRAAVLRLYRWSSPTLSLGCFQRYAEIERLPDELRSLAVIRRPTGGGAILHDREITYALILDHTLTIARQSPTALYRLVHECWRAVLAADGVATELAPDHYPLPTPRSGPFFCFEKPGQTDLIVGEKKLLGSAQRRIAGRVLQHGSLLLQQRFAAHPGVDLGGVEDARAANWEQEFVRRLSAALGLAAARSDWMNGDLVSAAERRARYLSDEWTQRR